jgi:hypothetical protein
MPAATDSILSKLLSIPVKRLIQSFLFPRDPSNVFVSEYENSFVRFFAAKKVMPEFQKEFADCEAFEFCDSHGNHQIQTTLASTNLTAGIDAVAIKPIADYLTENPNLPGINHTILLFNGANDRYERDGTLKDMALLAKATGARIISFNYSGIGRSATDDVNVRVHEFNDMVNNGIAMLNFLIEKEKIQPAHLIILGDSFGSATAIKVQKTFKLNQIDIRLIASNTFGSFRDVLHQEISSTIPPILGWLLPTKMTIGNALATAGWDAEPASAFLGISPYNYCLQRHGDKTLKNATLSSYIKSPSSSYTASIRYISPANLQNSALRLLNHSELTLSSIHQNTGDEDTHPLPLHYFGATAFKVINDYIIVTNRYIADYSCILDLTELCLPNFLSSSTITESNHIRAIL